MNAKFKWWEAETFAFVRVPKAILTNPSYTGLSANAALLYGILLDRMGLSAKNKERFTDRYGDVFVYCTLKDICETLSCGHDKATKMLKELEMYDSSAACNKAKADLPVSMFTSSYPSHRVRFFRIEDCGFLARNNT